MSFFGKILSLFKGVANETGDAIIDANALKILKQEIRESEEVLTSSKNDLAGILAKEMETERKIKAHEAEISKLENYAQDALSQGKEDLALEIATKISEEQDNLAYQQKVKEDYGAHASRLKSMFKDTQKTIDDLKRQLTVVQTTEKVQAATSRVSENYTQSSSRVLSAKQSLERIKKRQQERQDKLVAGQSLEDEMNGKSLEDKLKAAGISSNSGGSGAQAILAKLKAKNQA